MAVGGVVVGASLPFPCPACVPLAIQVDLLLLPPVLGGRWQWTNEKDKTLTMVLEVK